MCPKNSKMAHNALPQNSYPLPCNKKRSWMPIDAQKFYNRTGKWATDRSCCLTTYFSRFIGYFIIIIVLYLQSWMLLLHYLRVLSSIQMIMKTHLSSKNFFHETNMIWASKFSLSISEWYEFLYILKCETICPATRSDPQQGPLLFPDAVRYKAVHLSLPPFQY